MPIKSTAGSEPLPIDPLIPELLGRLRRHRALVLQAPPGAGKTTRVPPALLELGGKVLVLEPRRLAARLAARRVAFERGEKPGQSVGYQVRFEEATGPDTRLVFMTDGVLLRRLLADPCLREVSCVVLDEFHERRLESDLALALLRRLQQTTRPELRLVVMSATLNAAPLAALLGCQVLQASAGQFPLVIHYTPLSSEPLEIQVTAALQRLLSEGLEGDVLVFLPGAAEIRRAMRACEGLARRASLLLLPLHGDLPVEEQERAIAPAPQRKVIFSTNVAESSVTIEGITAVIDSGLARVASHSPWSGLPRLEVRRISKASAAQRAGRAGRTGPGQVVRLYPLEDFARRPEHDTPEILREDLSSALLTLRAMRFEPCQLEFLDAPPQQAWEAAERLLVRLGALDELGRITAIGAEMARLPLEPRLAKLVLEADRRGASQIGCAVAALLSAGDRLASQCEQSGPSDLLLLLEGPWSRQARQLYRQLRRHLGAGSGWDEQALLVAVLAAFPDRVARRRRDNELLLASGEAAVLSPSSTVRAAPFLVAVDVEERLECGLPLVRLASAIEREWLLDLFPERISERSALEWNQSAERVERLSQLLYDQLIIEETRSAAVNGDEEASRLLAEQATQAGVARFADPDEIEWFLARVEFAAAQAGFQPLNEQDVKAALSSLCWGRASFGEIEAAARNGGLLRALEQRLAPQVQAQLERVAPGRIRLPSGRQVRVHYARGRPPWIAAQIQELFGQREGPRIASGKVPLVVELLGPNRRPLQTTSDLEGFWRRLYPELRRELARRYPRHNWPEDPLTARPSFR